MKMKHVSVFRVKPEYRNPETIAEIKQKLLDLPKDAPMIIENEIGVKPFPMPIASPDGMVDFYDLIQIITFADEEGCMGYPASKGHVDFVEYSSKYMEKVVGLDYPME